MFLSVLLVAIETVEDDQYSITCSILGNVVNNGYEKVWEAV